MKKVIVFSLSFSLSLPHNAGLGGLSGAYRSGEGVLGGLVAQTERVRELVQGRRVAAGDRLQG